MNHQIRKQELRAHCPNKYIVHLVQCVYVNWRTTTSHYLPKSIKRELQNSADEATRRVLIKNYRGQHSKLVRCEIYKHRIQRFLSSIRNIEKAMWIFSRRLGIFFSTESFGNFAKVSYFRRHFLINMKDTKGQFCLWNLCLKCSFLAKHIKFIIV